jgi:ribonuclease HI
MLHTKDNNRRLRQLAKLYGDNVKLSDVLLQIDNENNYVDVYAHGSTHYNGKERLASIGVFFGDNDPRNISRLVNSTGIEVEIIACIDSLKELQKNDEPSCKCKDSGDIPNYGNSFVNIYTNSKLVVDAMNNACSITKHLSFFTELIEISDKFVNINWIHVKGRSITYGNEMADKLSRKCLLQNNKYL